MPTLPGLFQQKKSFAAEGCMIGAHRPALASQNFFTAFMRRFSSVLT